MKTIEDRAKLARETRAFTIDDMEVREDSKTGGLTFDGIASMVDTPYSVRDMFGDYEETILAGAFTRTIKQRDDVRLLKNHDPNYVFARTKSGTLELSAPRHLRAVAPALDAGNPNVQVLRSELGRGDVDQMSIGFRVKDQVWSEDYTQRTIKEVALFDVSIVTYPASPTTTASMRSFDEWLESLRDFDLTPDDIVRAHKFFAEKLPTPEAQPVVTASGLIVTDDLRTMWEHIKAPIAA